MAFRVPDKNGMEDHTTPWWVVLLIAGILYGSWIPFDLSMTRLDSAWTHRFPPLGFPHSSLEDILVNIVVYVPVGLGLNLLIRRRRPVFLRSVFISVCMALSVSFVAECGQVLSASRAPSWIDVGVNAFGATLGALMEPFFLMLLHGVVVRARRTIAERPMMVAATVLSILWVMLSLTPFRFVPDTVELHDRFLLARWTLVPSVTWSAASVADLLQTAAPLMIACACLAREHVARRWSAWLAGISALKHAVMLIVVTEALRTFTVTEVFDLSRIPLMTAASALAIGLSLIHRPGVRRVVSPADMRINQGFLPTLALLGAAHLAAGLERWASTGDAIVPLFQRSLTLPFEALWRTSSLTAAGQMMATATRAGLLALVLMALIGGQRSARLPVLVALATTVGFAMIQWAGSEPGKATFDITGPMLAWITAVVAVRSYALLRPQLVRGDV